MGPPVTASTFPDLLMARLRTDPGQPLLTMYDDATGERTELSVTTYANWVAKTAGVLTDELMLDPGDLLLVQLPPHWLGAVFLGAAWTAGIRVTTDPADDAQARVCGPDDVTQPGPPTLATALLPFARPFTAPPTGDVIDFGVVWPGQPDVFVAAEPVTAATAAWAGDHTQGDLLEAAYAAAGGRLLTDVDPLHGHGVPAFLGPLATGGSIVLVRHPDPGRWDSHAAAEHTTAELRAG